MKSFVVLGLIAAIGVTAALAQLNFKLRPGWSELDREVLALLEQRLSPAELKKFVDASESQDLVRKHYLRLAGPGSPKAPGKASFVLGSMAVLFTDLGNQHVGKNDLKNAGTFAALALRLNANHVPAMFTLIEIYIKTGNCSATRSLIEMGRETVARLKAIPTAKLPEFNRSAPSMYDTWSRQLDIFAKACP